MGGNITALHLEMWPAPGRIGIIRAVGGAPGTTGNTFFDPANLQAAGRLVSQPVTNGLLTLPTP